MKWGSAKTGSTALWLERSSRTYHMWRNTPCFSYGDISRTLFSRKDCTDSSNMVQSKR
nr:MAG TPA: envelope protein [Caudoviricetes sp.]